MHHVFLSRWLIAFFNSLWELQKNLSSEWFSQLFFLWNKAFLLSSRLRMWPVHLRRDLKPFTEITWFSSGALAAFKTWCGHQYRVGIICPPLVEIGLRWLPKLGVDTSPRPHVHMRTCNFRFEIKSTGNRQMSNALVPWQWAILHNWLNEYIPGRTRDIQMKCLDTYILFILYIILESNHFCLRKTNRKNSS